MSIQNPIIPCQICKAQEFKRWRWEDLEACCSCGHVRRSSLISAGEHNERMQDAYFGADFAQEKDAFTRFYDYLNAKRCLRELRKFVAEGVVLEVGVGRGNLLLALRFAGYQVEGIDLSQAVCSALRTRYGLPVHCRTLEEHAEETVSGTYDAIIMCHVLEHIESPLSSLHAVRYLLKKCGILYLAVPNVGAWNAHFPGWTAYEPYHVHYFRLPSLRRILETANFNVTRVKTVEPLSGWFNTLMRSLRHQTPNLKASVHGTNSNAHANGLIRGAYNVLRLITGLFLSPLRWLQSIKGRGEELVVIARSN